MDDNKDKFSKDIYVENKIFNSRNEKFIKENEKTIALILLVSTFVVFVFLLIYF